MSWITQPSPHCSRLDDPQSFSLTEFNTQTIRAFQNIVNVCVNRGQPFLPIFIESYGGNVDFMNAMLSIMDGYRKDIKFVTVTNGVSCSAGAYIFCYGNEGHRFMGPYSRLLLHNFSTGGQGRIPELIHDNKKFEQIETGVFERISKHLKKPKDYIRKNLEKRKNFDWGLTAEEAVKEGLASAVDSPQFIIAMEEKFIIAPGIIPPGKP